MVDVTEVGSDRRGRATTVRAPLWAWLGVGMAIGFGLALSRLAIGRVLLALLTILAIAVVANPWTRRRRRLDDMHRTVAANNPLLR